MAERIWLDRNESGQDTTEGHYSQEQIEQGHEIQTLAEQQRGATLMPDQPSKESLERATPKEFVLSIWPNATAFLANMYWPGQGERKKWIVLRTSADSMSQVQADSEDDAWKLAAHKITARELRQQNAALVEALRSSVVALDDWLNDWASDFCDKQRVEEARKRINEHGTIGYIATIQEKNRTALALYAPADAPGKEQHAKLKGGDA